MAKTLESDVIIDLLIKGWIFSKPIKEGHRPFLVLTFSSENLKRAVEIVNTVKGRDWQLGGLSIRHPLMIGSYGEIKDCLIILTEEIPNR